jgi:DNA-directed RNA polymerase specialized sigma subunit
MLMLLTQLKLDIQRTTLDLLLQLGRAPTNEEIRSKLGLKKERYNEVVRASKRVMSLNEYDRTTKEELINTIPDQENGNYSSIPPQNMLRLGLDDAVSIESFQVENMISISSKTFLGEKYKYHILF